MIQIGIFSLLTGFPGVAALVGTRVIPVTLPEPPILPALTYQFAGGSSQPTFETSGMQKQRVQFDCWGQSYDDAASLRAALIAALNGYQGALSDGTYLQNAELLQSMDFFENEARQYRCMVEFYLWYDFPS